MATSAAPYAARLNVDYPGQLDRITSFLRPLWIIPIAIVYSLLTSTGNETVVNSAGQQVTHSSGGILTGLFIATALMIVVRVRYPRWWFDFAREMARFGTRVGAYFILLTDRYPSTVDEQSVHLDIDYPDVEHDLNRWLPLVKWFLAIPHYIVLAVLACFAIVAVVVAWFAILFTGSYPRALFDFVVGVGRWGMRVYAYAFLLVTDQYPPFSLE
ncbi:MAG TPA: DUF4389 domain-containing protein [Thermomicrobiaceae bacterium]|nr:DUF4389 domain-containing protein [Thermomicrobiaceae bacterium]